MPAGGTTLILDANDAATGSSQSFQRRRRDDGQVQIEFTPSSTPSTVTVKVQASVDAGQEAPWTTIKSFTQAELGTAGGSVLEKILLGPHMRAVTSNLGNSDDNVKVWILE